MEKRDNTAKDLMTITYMIFYIAAAVTAITGGEGTAAYLPKTLFHRIYWQSY